MSLTMFDRVRLTVNKMKKEQREEVRLVLLHKLCRYLMTKVPLQPIRTGADYLPFESVGNWEYIYSQLLERKYWDIFSVNYLIAFIFETMEFNRTLTIDQKHFVWKEMGNG